MQDKVFKNIIKEIKSYSIHTAKENGWDWYYYVHQKEVVRCAEILLGKHKANNEIVVIAAWLHDISKYSVRLEKFTHAMQKRHNIDSAKIADKLLDNLGLDKKEREQVRQCILRHRNGGKYKVRNIEEKVLTVADAMSHFTGVFYFLHHKFHSEDSVEEMVEKHIEKFEEDWRDLGLLPGAKKLVKKEYDIFMKLHKNYKSN